MNKIFTGRMRMLSMLLNKYFSNISYMRRLIFFPNLVKYYSS